MLWYPVDERLTDGVQAVDIFAVDSLVSCAAQDRREPRLTALCRNVFVPVRHGARSGLCRWHIWYLCAARPAGAAR
jgi:hypothetical protein